MKYATVLLLTLSASPALANFTCVVERQCGGGACEAFSGGPLTLREAAGAWQVGLGGAEWEAYPVTEIAPGGEINLVIPPQDGMSGLITVTPAGALAFTAHAGSEDGLVAITGEGTCTSEAG